MSTTRSDRGLFETGILSHQQASKIFGCMPATYIALGELGWIANNDNRTPPHPSFLETLLLSG